MKHRRELEVPVGEPRALVLVDRVDRGRGPALALRRPRRRIDREDAANAEHRRVVGSRARFDLVDDPLHPPQPFRRIELPPRRQRREVDRINDLDLTS